jgi:hypothetical protein
MSGCKFRKFSSCFSGNYVRSVACWADMSFASFLCESVLLNVVGMLAPGASLPGRPGLIVEVLGQGAQRFKRVRSVHLPRQGAAVCRS